MGTRGKFAGGDQAYLRDEQYRDATRLAARAGLHARYGTAQVGWFRWVAAQIDWPSGGEVLEVGCGAGWLWAEAADGLPGDLRLTLTDLSPGMAEAARAQVEAVGRYELAAARAADVQDLPFPAAAFDVVIANHVLFHAPDVARAAAEMARIVRPGGVVMAATSGAQHLRELWALKAEVWGGPLVSETVEVFGPESGAAHLARRFTTVEWREYEDELHCTDAGDVVDFVTSTPPGEDGTPGERAALRRAVEREMAAAGGVLRVTKETGVLLARHPRG